MVFQASWMHFERVNGDTEIDQKPSEKRVKHYLSPTALPVREGKDEDVLDSLKACSRWIKEILYGVFGCQHNTAYSRLCRGRSSHTNCPGTITGGCLFSLEPIGKRSREVVSYYLQWQAFSVLAIPFHSFPPC